MLGVYEQRKCGQFKGVPLRFHLYGTILCLDHSGGNTIIHVINLQNHTYTHTK